MVPRSMLPRCAIFAVGLLPMLLASVLAQTVYGPPAATPRAYSQPVPNYSRPPAGNQYAAPVPGRYAPINRPQPQVPVRPPYRIAQQPQQTPAAAGPQLSREHPLMPLLRNAYAELENVERIQDYSATLVKRERVDGKLGEPQYMFLKVRHKPFSVYSYFLGPANLKGQEVLYVDGLNDGKMWAHSTGIQNALVGTVSIPPDGMLAMRGQRYPITEIGVLNLARRLVEVGEQDVKYGECRVKFYKGAKINDRVCTCSEVIHPVPRSNFRFHLARVYVDDELNIPIRYESYDWPAKPGDPPALIEEYTYLNLKLNCGLTDADFDPRNPNYRFR